MNDNLISRLRRLCAFIIGIVFLLAGIFKALDPVGAGLVMEGYLKFFHLAFLLPAAKALAVAFALTEAVLGAALVSGVWRKPVAVASTALIVFFTVLTLLLAIFNPVTLTDCGCFGEVVHLTNLQTFIKNLVLLALALAAFLPFRNMGENKKRKYASFGIVCASVIAFTVYSLVSIPLVDYTAFSPGSELSAAGDTDREGTQGYYKSTLIYEKNGQQGVFELNKLPDSTWTFVRSENTFIRSTEIEDNSPSLPFTDAAGDYHDSLAVQGNVLAISAYSPAKVKEERWTEVADALDSASRAGFTPLLLLSCTDGQFHSLKALGPDVLGRLEGWTFFADRKDLVTLNRSNGGAVWLSDGQIVRKFASGDLPSGKALRKMAGKDPTEEMLNYSTKGRLHFQGFVLYVFAILLIL